MNENVRKSGDVLLRRDRVMLTTDGRADHSVSHRVALHIDQLYRSPELLPPRAQITAAARPLDSLATMVTSSSDVMPVRLTA